jgi:hypothetical protein
LDGGGFFLPFEEDVKKLTDRDFVQSFPADWLVRMQFVEVATAYPAAGQVSAFD